MLGGKRQYGGCVRVCVCLCECECEARNGRGKVTLHVLRYFEMSLDSSLAIFIFFFIFSPMAEDSPALRLGSPLSVRVGRQLGSISDVLHARARQQRTAAEAGRSPPHPAAARSCQSAPCLRARRLSLSVLSSLLRARPSSSGSFSSLASRSVSSPLVCPPVVECCLSCVQLSCPFVPPSFQRDFPSYSRSCCSDLSKLE